MIQILTESKGEIHNSTIFGNFNTPLSIMERTIRPQVYKEVEHLNHGINQVD